MSELTWSFKQVLVTADEADDEADDGYSAIVTTVPAPTQTRSRRLPSPPD